MSATRLPQLGSVIWAELEDANGIRKTRPAVVVSASSEITANKPIRVVAITTRIPDPLPDDHIMLPWDRQGKARSGLRRKCAAVASWNVAIQLDDVGETVGNLPTAVIREILEKTAATLPQPPDAAGPPAEAKPENPPPA